MTGDDSAARRLAECARTLRQHVKKLHPDAGTSAPRRGWLLDNHSFLQAQIGETGGSLRPSYLRELSRGSVKELRRNSRVYQAGGGSAASVGGVIDAAKVE